MWCSNCLGLQMFLLPIVLLCLELLEKSSLKDLPQVQPGQNLGVLILTSGLELLSHPSFMGSCVHAALDISMQVVSVAINRGDAPVHLFLLLVYLGDLYLRQEKCSFPALGMGRVSVLYRAEEQLPFPEVTHGRIR